LKFVGDVRELQEGRVEILLRSTTNTTQQNASSLSSTAPHVLADLNVSDFAAEELGAFLQGLAEALQGARALAAAEEADVHARDEDAARQLPAAHRSRNTVESRVRLLHLAQTAIADQLRAAAAVAGSAAAGSGFSALEKAEEETEEMAPMFDVMGGDSHLLLCAQSYLVKISAQHGARRPHVETGYTLSLSLSLSHTHTHIYMQKPCQWKTHVCPYSCPMWVSYTCVS
jgi:hypothetical protein